jgi:hypothetical protein
LKAVADDLVCRLPKKYCEDWKKMKESLGKLKLVTARIMTFAHGLPIVSETQNRLLQVINSEA